MVQVTQRVKPLYDKILIKRTEHEETTMGGIIIPDTAQEKTQFGTVVARGEGKRNQQGVLIPLNVKDGDTVLFGKYAGTEIKLGTEEYLILREEEILGVIEQE